MPWRLQYLGAAALLLVVAGPYIAIWLLYFGFKKAIGYDGG